MTSHRRYFSSCLGSARRKKNSPPADLGVMGDRAEEKGGMVDTGGGADGGNSHQNQSVNFTANTTLEQVNMPSEEQISQLILAAEDPVALMLPDKESSKAFARVVEDCVVVVDYVHALLKSYPPEEG